MPAARRLAKSPPDLTPAMSLQTTLPPVARSTTASPEPDGCQPHVAHTRHNCDQSRNPSHHPPQNRTLLGFRHRTPRAAFPNPLQLQPHVLRCLKSLLRILL